MVPLLFQLVVSLIVGGAVFLLVFSVFRYPVPAEPPIHRRIASAVGIHRNTVFENPALAPLMNMGLAAARRMSLRSLRERVRQDLDASGNPSGYSVQEYLAICIVTAGVLGLLGLLFELLITGSPYLFFTPVLFVGGFGVPLWALHDAGKRRTARVAKQLPYTLDLVSLTMAAGSSFTEAVETLIRDNPEDDLNQELALALREIDFGSTRSAALANMAQRIPLESLRSVVGAVNQAERLGTPMASTLKLQADMLRMQRSVRAEKLSASASLRILIPSMLILIAVVIIVFAPILIAGNFNVLGN